MSGNVYPAGTQTNFVFIGEAGCGKSELAINLAHRLRREGDMPVCFFDLDMTKPLFRSRDQRDSMEAKGISVRYEEQFMDAPTAAGGVVRLLKDQTCYTILDVGGDYIGARAIGGYAGLLNRANTAVCYVINPYRPWSTTLEHIDRVLGETLGASHLRLDQIRLIANPNTGSATTAHEVIAGWRLLNEAVAPYKQFDCLCVWETLYDAVKGQIPIPVVPVHLNLTYPWDGCEAVEI